MKDRRLILTMVLLATALTAAVAGGDEELLLQLCDSMAVAESKGESELLARVLDADAVLYAKDVPPIVGRDAIVSFYEMIFLRFELETRYEDREVTLDGDTATVVGSSSRTMKREGSETRTETEPYRFEFRKRSGAGWTCSTMVFGERSDSKSRIPGLPAPTGPYSIGSKRLLFVDRDRPEPFTEDALDRRQVAVHLWYPAVRPQHGTPERYRTRAATRAAAAFHSWPLFFNSYFVLVDTHSYLDATPAKQPARYPLLFYNHGYDGFATVHTALCEELASHGYVVASVVHAHESTYFELPDGTLRTFDPDNPLHRARLAEAHGDTQEAAKDRLLNAGDLESRAGAYRELLRLSPGHQESTRLWAADNRFVLDEFTKLADAGADFAKVMDRDRVGVLGHSLGGATAGQLAATDDRFVAGINMDGFQFGDVLDHPFEVPFMYMAPERPWLGEHAISADLFFHRSKSAAYLMSIDGIQHSSFTDLPLFESAWGASPPDLTGERILQIQRAYVVSFFDRHLKGIDAPLMRANTDEFPEVFLRAKKPQQPAGASTTN